MKIGCVLVMVPSLCGVAMADEVMLDRVCVELDASDVLVDADRERAVLLMRQVLEREDQLVVTTACTETFTLTHERALDGIVIRLRSSAGKRKMRTPSLEELPTKYGKLARSLLESKTAPAAERPSETPPIVVAAAPMATELPTVYPAPAIYEPVEAKGPDKSVWYFLVGIHTSGGSNGTFGYRYHASSLSIDLSGSARSGGSEPGDGGASLGAELLARRRSGEGVAVYGGGGLSIGGNTTGYASGGGLQSELTAGVDVGRSLHALLQIDLTLPLYKQDDGSYAPSFVMSAGIGW
jgi:hypothetical protein